MEIKIDSKYKIISDSRQLILQEEKTVLEGDKKGETYSISLGYYSTLKGVLRGYRELQIRKSDARHIDDLITLIKKLDKKIDKLSEEIKISFKEIKNDE